MIPLLPKNEILLWRMILTGEEPTKSQVKPAHSSRDRKPLEENGLIEYKTQVKGGKRSTCLVLTDKAWDWATKTPPSAIERSKSPQAAAVLQLVLAKLVSYLERQNLSLVDIIRPPEPISLDQRILLSCQELGGRHQRVYLSDLRKKLSDLPRNRLDQELLQMEAQDQVAIMPLDDPLSITPEIDAAAIDILGYKKHILRLKIEQC
ncbi:hypothetical protein L1047_16335 [Synechococcus sp. Nb3U1]|uniref:hypothetical protein n=1 Tax=Synechococcus sp. Nb3U1 TaxID=1914529 RepID=UPI001F3DFB40|nr:hypothetical protein [Synechococcus sp. Nb3U1]MCF2972764.1 hypothetical protein [Synechococcus sp. Nb3U1]